MYRPSRLFLLIALLFAVPASASFFDDFVPKAGQKIGIFIGTFDPFHAGHQSILDKAMTEAGLDFMVVIPSNATTHKPNASSFKIRLKMIQTLFGKSDRIIVPNTQRHGEGPIGTRLTRRIRKMCPTCPMFGIKGSDTAANPFTRLSDRLALSDVHHWIVFDRDAETAARARHDLTAASKYSFITAENQDTSSTLLRNWFAAHPEFYKTPGAPTEFPPGLSAEMIPIIRENHLYDPRAGENHPIFAVESFDPDQVVWKTGQLMGVSDRAGRSPFIVQAATHSPIDHVAVIAVEADGVYAYEFINVEGVTKTPIRTVLERARGKSGHIMAVVAEPKFKVSRSDAEKMSAYMIRMMAEQKQYGMGKVPGGPKSCSQLVHGIYHEIGHEVGHPVPVTEFDLDAFGHFTGDHFAEIIFDNETLLSPKALFTDKFRVVHSNMPSNLEWDLPEILAVWKDEGDLSKIARGLALKEKTPLRTESEIEKGTQNLIEFLENHLAPEYDRVTLCHRILKKIPFIQTLE